MKLKNILFFLLQIFCGIKAEQFIYPVAAIDQEGKEILIVHQKSLDDIELLIWNSTTKLALKGLLSMYVPAGVKMLPSGVGFSFMDEGRLRVKNFYKRSPKTIAIYAPISKITDIHWISDDAFYFSAKEGNAYNIFSSNTLGEVQRCTSGQDFDYLYPCKRGSQVFCIQKDKSNGSFKIVKIKWWLCDFDSENQCVQPEEVLIETSRSISYLHMISDEEGFYLDYSAMSSQELRENLLFSCWRVFKDSKDIWQTEVLFDFKLPIAYVIGKEEKRLYESIAPLLPYYSDKRCVYFIDAQDDGSLQVKKYNKEYKTIEVVVSTIKNGHSFSECIAPLVVGNTLYTGFVIKPDDFFDRMIDMDGTIFLDLPELMLENT